MEHRNLGRTGLRVSRVCLGTMMFGIQQMERIGQKLPQMLDGQGGEI